MGTQVQLGGVQQQLCRGQPLQRAVVEAAGHVAMPGLAVVEGVVDVEGGRRGGQD